MAAIAAVSILVPFENAFAEEPPAARRGWTPEAEQSRVGVEIDFLHRGRREAAIDIVTADLTAQIGVTRHVFIDADIPAGLVMSNGVVAGVFGDPVLGAHYAARFDRRTSGYLGASVGLPLAGALRPDFVDQLSGLANTVRAWHDPGHFLPHAVPVAVRGGLELDLAPVILQMEVSPGMVFNLREATLAAYVDTAASAALRARFGLEGGLRAQATFLVVSADDLAQLALEPFIGYATPGRVGLYARYGLLVAIDKPLGFGGDGDVTHRLSVGAKF